MEVDYERTSRHNYLILREMTEIEEESFSVQMILRNPMTGLLVCGVRYLEGKQCFFYEITSRQSLSALLEQKKLSCQEIKAIFESLFEVIERVDEYLLGPEQLLLEPEYIYGDTNGKKYSFCFCPACNRDIFQQIRNLAEEMLPYIDHQDKQAVLLGYGIYRISMEDNIEIGQMKAVLESYKNQPKEKKVLQEDEGIFDSVQEDEEKRAQILDKFFKEDETENESFLQKIINKFLRKKKRKEEKKRV